MSNSYKSILKATSLIAGSKLVSIFFRIIQAKAVALLIGPSGTGLVGLLQSSVSLVQTTSSLGISNSAVRDIASAHNQNKTLRLSKVIQSFRKIVLVTGVLGMSLTFLLARNLSQLTFASPEYVWEIRLLALAVFFNIIKAGQEALIQGLRRIKDLALMSIIGSALSTVISIPLIYFLNIDGLALYIVFLAIGQFFVSWFFARRIRLKSIDLSWNEIFQNGKGMLNLGLAFMGGSLATIATTYFIRVILAREFDLNGVGLYQSALTLSGIYLNIILQAMGKDFYPRLAGVANQPEREAEMINQQTEVGVLLSAPGLLLILALAPFVIELFYSSKYIGAYPILQWMIFGVFIKSISWPMGYLFLARSKTKLFFFTQIISNGFHLVAVLILTYKFGLVGSGLAYFSLYLFHVIYLKYLTKKEINFSWSKENLKTFFVVILVFIVSGFVMHFLNNNVSTIAICVLSVLMGIYSLRRLAFYFGLGGVVSLLKLLSNRFKK